MRLRGPVLDSGDALALAAFYERLLGWPMVASDPGGWARLEAPEGGLKLEFQGDPQFEPPVWPTVAGRQQMMLHLDIAVEDLERGVAWAKECGAREAAEQPRPQVRVMLDPDGHPFCLFRGPT
jgi:hypothetical protein